MSHTGVDEVVAVDLWPNTMVITIDAEPAFPDDISSRVFNTDDALELGQLLITFGACQTVVAPSHSDLNVYTQNQNTVKTRPASGPAGATSTRGT